MKKEVEQVKENRVLDFPNRINVIFIFIFLLLYVFILGVVLVYVVPKPNYTIIPEYEHITEYNSDLNSYVKVSRRIDATETEGVVTFNHTNTVIAYVRSNSSVNIAKYKANFSALTAQETMQYFSEQTGTNISSNTHYLISSAKVDGDGFNNIFGKINYQMITDSESKKEDKEIKFNEKVIELKKSELDDSKFTNKNNFDTQFKFSILLSKSDKTYNVTTSLSLEKANTEPHMDFQAFYVTKDEEIIPFLGWYNIGTIKMSEARVSNTNSYPESLGVEYIYVKAYYTFNGEVTEALYRVKTSSLLA